jgi:MoaA/NifB/PqqE/SkfB family radical SAM enzyme
MGKVFSLERLSIDLSNRCSKQCDFCYNSSNSNGSEAWTPKEIITLLKDCAENGLQAISLGGGEPFEYNGIFEIISTMTPLLFVSVTTNGLPLRNKITWDCLLQNKPDKIHVTIHNPENEDEISHALFLVQALKKENIRSGINLLVSSDKVEKTKRLFRQLEINGISRKEIILIPRKYSLQPTPQEIAEIAENKPFQSPSCLTFCKPSERFASISWDKKINYCSYSPSKMPLQELSYRGIIDALHTINFETCRNLIPVNK